MKFAILAVFPMLAAYAQETARVLTWLDEPGRLLTVGQETVVRVRLTEQGGGPVAGVEVTFATPASGPTGEWTEGTAATTDDDGVASAILRGGAQLGPYLVEARAAGGGSVTFGISNVPARTAAPALSAAAARRTLETKAPAGAAVYGPVWIPALTTVVAAGPASIFSASASFTTQVTGSWLFWIDPTPGMLFGHTVQFVIVDASRSDANLPTARFTRELWWPAVRLSGAARAAAMLPPSALSETPVGEGIEIEAAEGRCAIVAAGPGSAGAMANAVRLREFFPGRAVTALLPAAGTREGIAAAAANAAEKGCSTVYLYVTAHGFPPRTAREPVASLGGIVLAGGDTGFDFVEFGDLARALEPLKGKARLSLVFDAAYAGNARSAFSGLGLSGEILAGSDESSAPGVTAEGTPFGAELIRLWDAAIESGRTFDLGQMQASSRFKVRYGRIEPEGAKALAAPNFSLGGSGVFARSALRLPDDLPAGPISAKIAAADPRTAEVDPPLVSVGGSSEFPQLTVFAAAPGLTDYSVELTAGGSTYLGRGVIAVGQEVSCTPSRLTVIAGYSGEVRIAPGAFYEAAFNGTSFNARLFDDRLARVSPGQVTLGTASDTLRISGIVKGITNLEITGTRAYGPAYTACLVEVEVIPEVGEGTLSTVMYVGQTDAALQRVTTQVRTTSDTVNDLTLAGEVVCTTGSAPPYAGIGSSGYALQRNVSGSLDAQVACFWPTEGVSPPLFRFATFFGGKGLDTAASVVADARGDVFLVGTTESTDLAVTAGGRRHAGKKDVFVAKISRFGDKVLFATYLGGMGNDIATAAAVDPAGNLYVTGYTVSDDFPATNTAFQKRYVGGTDALLFKLNGQTGALVYSTFYGSLGDEVALGIAVDAQGSAYIAGQTSSQDLPVTPGVFQQKLMDGPPCPHAGMPPCPDAFVARFAPDGVSLVYATFLGGSNNDYAYAIAVDAGGNAFVAGGSSSSDFPATAGAYQIARKAGVCVGAGGLYPCPDAFVAVLNPSGTALTAATLIGGDAIDEALRVKVDSAGNVYLFGSTSSQNLPATSGAIQTKFGGGPADSFLAAFGPGLKTLRGLTYFGGTGADAPGGLAVTPGGRVYFGLTTTEKDLPVPLK